MDTKTNELIEKTLQTVEAKLKERKYENVLIEIKELLDCGKCSLEGTEDCSPKICSVIEEKINEVLNGKK